MKTIYLLRISKEPYTKGKKRKHPKFLLLEITTVAISVFIPSSPYAYTLFSLNYSSVLQPAFRARNEMFYSRNLSRAKSVFSLTR